LNETGDPAGCEIRLLADTLVRALCAGGEVASRASSLDVGGEKVPEKTPRLINGWHAA
jgi:hypothetical protein